MCCLHVLWNCLTLQMFFIVHLYSCGTTAASLPPTRDPDPQFGGELADGRVALLVFCRERRLEFSTLRRASFTSMVLCHELHVEQANGVGRIIRCCRRCRAKTLLAYSCTTCEVSVQSTSSSSVTNSDFLRLLIPGSVSIALCFIDEFLLPNVGHRVKE